MNELVRTIAGWVGGLLFIAAAFGGTYLSGRLTGEQLERERWTEQVGRIDRAAEAERAEQARRVLRLVDRIDELRERPERVRTVTREVVKHVVADAECGSVPESLRWLWDAAGGGQVRAAAGAAGVADAGVRGLASAGR